MDVQKIKYNHELFKNKIRLENETIMINREIKKQQLKCNHIRICLGWDDGASSYFNTCLLYKSHTYFLLHFIMLALFSKYCIIRKNIVYYYRGEIQMDMFFLSNDDIAIALIESKYKILGENFITPTELSQFTTFIQHKFDENGLDVIIRAEGLSESDFTIENGVIAKSKECNNSLKMCIRDRD